jgi:hypothetical protein
VFVADDAGAIVGTYYLRANNRGGVAHVANCGYVLHRGRMAEAWRGRMCAHSLDEARRRKFKAMQFNFVVSSNDRAVQLWQGMGFVIVGRLPRAFEHPRSGFIDAYVMSRAL